MSARALIAALVAAILLAGCSSGESGTVNPQVQQMKAGSRGKP